jgi:starch synthase (maltosyl-transferring)
MDSEKYQIKVRDWQAPGHLRELIARVNTIRREHPAFQQNAALQFHPVDNPALLWFSKHDGADDRVFVIVNTDPHWMQHGWVEMPLELAGLVPGASYVVEDLLDGSRHEWTDRFNYVKLDPAERVAHVFVVRR